MKTQSWWVILVQGIVALALGLYLLVAPSQAWFQAGALAAIFLLVAGALDFFRDLFARLVLRSRMRRIRGLVGILFGGLLVLLAWTKPAWLSLATAYTILALGLIAFGGLGLWVAFFARRGRPMRWVSVLVNALFLFWGLAIFFDRSSEVDLKLVTVLVLLVVGSALVVWAIITRSRGGDEDAELAAAAPPVPGSAALPAATTAAATAAPAVSGATPTVTVPAASVVPASVAMPPANPTPVTDVVPITAAADMAGSATPAVEGAPVAAATDATPSNEAAASAASTSTDLISDSEPKPAGEQP